MRWIYPDSLVPGQYILVAAQKDKATELQDKIDNFKDRFMVELTIDMRIEQGLMSIPPLIAQCIWSVASDAMAESIHTGFENLQGGRSATLTQS